MLGAHGLTVFCVLVGLVGAAVGTFVSSLAGLVFFAAAYSILALRTERVLPAVFVVWARPAVWMLAVLAAWRVSAAHLAG